jgi:cob(I)alamin adenosyltransferase
MKIYTRTGDAGETSLFAGDRVSKGHVRVHAYGTIDELNTVLGLALAVSLDERLQTPVRRVQSELFVVGADLSTPLDAKTGWVVRVSPRMVEQLEGEIDEWETHLPPLKNFILPGGGLAGAFLHQARTVCRRAERWLVTLQGTEQVNSEVLRYVNRLSDWLFVAARLANMLAGQPEKVWQKVEIDD